MDINHIPAATAEDILYAGWLTKRGASIKNWKKRFFCLTGETLRYYEDDTQSILKGEIVLVDIIALHRRCPPFRFPIFEIEMENRMYSFQARNTDEMEHWLSQIQAADIDIKIARLPKIVREGIIKEGVMNKLGAIVKNWKSRKFTLYVFPEEKLVYETIDSHKVKGEIELCNIINVERITDQENMFEVQTPDRNFRLQTENTEEMLDWMCLIGAATRDAVCQSGESEKKQLRDAKHRSTLTEYDSVFMKEYQKGLRVLKQGWIKKRGFYVRFWRLRYFVLQMTEPGRPQLRYYLCPDTTVAQGSIDITSIIDYRCLPGTSKLEITVPGRIYELEAQTEMEAQEWITKLHFAKKEVPKEF